MSEDIDQVVAAALRALQKRPADAPLHEYALAEYVAAMGILRDAGRDLDPAQIREYLVQVCEWGPERASTIVTIVDKLNAGGKSGPAQAYWAPDILEQWEKEAQQPPDEPLAADS